MYAILVVVFYPIFFAFPLLLIVIIPIVLLSHRKGLTNIEQMEL